MSSLVCPVDHEKALLAEAGFTVIFTEPLEVMQELEGVVEPEIFIPEPMVTLPVAVHPVASVTVTE
jgi:hypothetical protein